MDKLKPCPFCGGEAYTMHTQANYVLWSGEWAVGCAGCGLLFGYDLDYGGHYEKEEYAIEAWNDRKDGDGDG